MRGKTVKSRRIESKIRIWKIPKPEIMQFRNICCMPGVSFKKDRWHILLDSQYVSERQEPDSVTGEYGAEDDFFVVNAAVNFDIMKNITLQFNADNLFDSEFYCSEATAGRTYTVGLRFMY